MVCWQINVKKVCIPLGVEIRCFIFYDDNTNLLYVSNLYVYIYMYHQYSNCSSVLIYSGYIVILMSLIYLSLQVCSVLNVMNYISYY